MHTASPLPFLTFTMVAGDLVTLPNAPDGATFILQRDNVAEASLLSLDTGLWVLRKHPQDSVLQNADLLFIIAQKDPEFPGIWARKKETYALYLALRQRIFEESFQGTIANKATLFQTTKKEPA